MSSLFDVLSMAGGALGASARGTQTAGHNISNASTAGFHRQELLLSSMGPATFGVRVDGVRRAVDNQLQARLFGQAGSASAADQRAAQLGQAEGVVGDLTELGVGAALDQFFAGWRQLAVAPADPMTRTEALNAASTLAARIRQAAGAIQQAQDGADQAMVAQVATVNARLEEVAQLNRTILAQEVSGTEASDLRDHRDRAVRELAELVGITAVGEANGQVTVLLGGVALVQGTAVRRLTTQPDPTTGFGRIVTAGGLQLDLTDRITGGAIGGLLAVRDRDLPAWMGQLDTFAFDLVSGLNAQHQLNFGLDGLNGRDLFVQPAAVAGAAVAMAVDPAIAADADRLGAALAGGLPGDGRGADAIVQLETALLTGGGQLTLEGGWAAFTAIVGADTRGAGLNVDLQRAQLGDLEALRESQSGVSIEEQLLLLERYQRAFQAALRVIEATDEMLETLLRM